MMLGGQSMSIPLPMSQCIVPDGINGPVGIWITSDGQPLVNNVRDRASTQLVAGPTLAFIDTQPQSLGKLARTGGGSSGAGSSSPTNTGSSSDTGSGSASASTSTSTRTISPAEASSIIASASATDSAGGAAPTVNSGSANPATNATPGKPNQFTGKSADGKLTVLGWSGLPSQ